MYRTFNYGIGMVLVVPAAQADDALARLNAAGHSAYLIGEITTKGKNKPVVEII